MDRQFDVRAWGTIALLVLAGFSSLAEAQTCLRTPISVPIKNVTIAGGARGAIARGIAISVGTPPQDIAFQPRSYNNTFIYNNTNLCRQIYDSAAYDSVENCVLRRGGAYDAASSTTRKEGNVSAVAVADPAVRPRTIINSDTLILNNNTKIDGYTFAVPAQDGGDQFYAPQSGIGLGQDSTFLNNLKSKGLIASRTWSIFWGRTGRDYASRSNGSVVFGGYDKSRVQQTNYTAKLNYTDCEWGTSVRVSFLGLRNKDNTETNLFNASSTTASRPQTPLYACIDPSYPGAAVIPYYNYMSNFVRLTKYDSFSSNSLGGATIRSRGYNFWDLLYLPGDSPYEGDLKMIFEDTVSIWIDNKELVTPDVFIDETSHTWKENGTQSVLLINANPASEADAGKRMRLSRNAMTFLYLMVNQDAGTFTIWQAVDDGSPENLQAVDEKGNLVASSAACEDSSGTTNTPGGGAASSPSATSTDTADKSSKMSTGAIAGIAVGGIAIVALIILGVLFFIRRGKKKQAAEEGAAPPAWTPQGTNDPTVIHEAGVQEVGGGAAGYYEPKYTDQVQKPAELGQSPATRTPGQAYHEMPTN